MLQAHQIFSVFIVNTILHHIYYTITITVLYICYVMRTTSVRIAKCM